MQSVVFLDYFEGLDDPRQRAKVLYPLDEILLLSLCGAISGAEDFTDIALYGKEKLEFLQTLLPFTHGIPSHDALNDLFRGLDAVAFGKAFTAWAGEQRRVLGQVAVSGKSNEITAIPALLDMLVLKGAIITIDAMGCQKAIADKIRARGADYSLALKGNHGDLLDDVKTFFESTEGKALTVHETTDANHGRIETHRYSMSDDTGWINAHNPGWQDLHSIGRVESRVEAKGIITRQVRFYICSLAGNLPVFAKAVRGHWSIENSLHWILDVVFREDYGRVRKDNAPQNFAIIKHAAINLINPNYLFSPAVCWSNI
jgi:predicted transposase YbfD/YdcC